MKTRLLDAISTMLEQSRSLSVAEEDAMADAVISLVYDLQWARTLASPEGQETLRQLTLEAITDVANGDVEAGGFDGR